MKSHTIYVSTCVFLRFFKTWMKITHLISFEKWIMMQMLVHKDVEPIVRTDSFIMASFFSFDVLLIHIYLFIVPKSSTGFGLMVQVGNTIRISSPRCCLNFDRWKMQNNNKMLKTCRFSWIIWAWGLFFLSGKC